MGKIPQRGTVSETAPQCGCRSSVENPLLDIFSYQEQNHAIVPDLSHVILVCRGARIQGVHCTTGMTPYLNKHSDIDWILAKEHIVVSRTLSGGGL